MNKISVIVLQPFTTKISGDFDHVIIPGAEGDFGVYAEHTPFITKIRPGILQLFNDGSVQKYAIHDGFVSVDANQIRILCETIEGMDEIDLSRAEAARQRAEKRMKETAEADIDFRRAEVALKKALVRIGLKKNES